jgi:hypothetical protein
MDPINDGINDRDFSKQLVNVDMGIFPTVPSSNYGRAMFLTPPGLLYGFRCHGDVSENIGTCRNEQSDSGAMNPAYLNEIVDNS